MNAPAPSRNDTDFLRFLAIALIVNSHMDACYPIQYLGTGGAIGNALFFMLSSFGLFLSYRRKPTNFIDYYANRIRRIYPVWWLSLFLILLPYKYFETFLTIKIPEINNILSFLTSFLYPYQNWFLHALMMYYLLLFPVLKYFSEKKICYFMLLIAALYSYIYLNQVDLTRWTVEGTYIRYFSYLLIFLFGAIIANRNDRIKYGGFQDWTLLFLFLTLFYAHKFLMLKNFLLSFQFVQQLLLIPIIFYLFKVSRSRFMQKKVMEFPVLSTVIKFVSNRTLEIFVAHGWFIFVVLSFHIAFPANVIIVLTLTVIMASLMNYIAQRFLLPLLEIKIL